MVDLGLGVAITAFLVVLHLLALKAENLLAEPDEVVVSLIELSLCPAHFAAELDIVIELHDPLRLRRPCLAHRLVDDGAQQVGYFFRSALWSVVLTLSLARSAFMSSSSS